MLSSINPNMGFVPFSRQTGSSEVLLRFVFIARNVSSSHSFLMSVQVECSVAEGDGSGRSSNGLLRVGAFHCSTLGAL